MTPEGIIKSALAVWYARERAWIRRQGTHADPGVTEADYRYGLQRAEAVLERAG